jgi:hypothetical protein
MPSRGTADSRGWQERASELAAHHLDLGFREPDAGVPASGANRSASESVRMSLADQAKAGGSGSGMNSEYPLGLRINLPAGLVTAVPRLPRRK